MFGIVGYSGHAQAYQVLIDGLNEFEYRGYGSAGMPTEATVHVEYTRWAVHGKPHCALAGGHSPAIAGLRYWRGTRTLCP